MYNDATCMIYCVIVLYLQIQGNSPISLLRMGSPPKLTSDLCKSLPDLLADKSSVMSMLNYFIQFMESEKAIHIIEFWLAVEAFKSAKSSVPITVPSPGGAVSVVSWSTGTHPHSLGGVCSDQDHLKQDRPASLQEIPSHVDTLNRSLQRSHEISHELSNKFYNVSVSPGTTRSKVTLGSEDMTCTGVGSKVKHETTVGSKVMLETEKGKVTMATDAVLEFARNSWEANGMGCFSSEENVVSGWKGNHSLMPSLPRNASVTPVTTQGMSFHVYW